MKPLDASLTEHLQPRHDNPKEDGAFGSDQGLGEHWQKLHAILRPDELWRIAKRAQARLSFDGRR